MYAEFFVVLKKNESAVQVAKLLNYHFNQSIEYTKRQFVIVGNPNRKKMHIFGFVGIFEYIC